MNKINHSKQNDKKNMQQESFGKFDFVANLGLFGGISLVLTLVSLVYLALHGISYGIDFKGGTELQAKFKNPVAVEKIREVTQNLNLGDVSVQAFEGDEVLIRFQGQKGSTDKETNELLLSAINSLKEKLNSTFSSEGVDIVRVDTVGPQVGAELKRDGFLSVFYCLLIIFIYVALRFDYKYSPGAVVCLFHDAVITLAIFVFVGKEVNIPILAAILTLIGFSLNDTIVVFDRIRETEHLYSDRGFSFVINKSINDMLGRTIITSGTVFISSLCLLIFANGVVSDIAFAITVGIVFGVYSSIYVAAPFILLMDRVFKKQSV